MTSGDRALTPTAASVRASDGPRAPGSFTGTDDTNTETTELRRLP
jgi:hypothetical protein